MSKQEFFVYLLTPISPEWTMKKSYVGFTNNPKRRIRQHNRQIKGGAKKTNPCKPWKFVGWVTGFETKVEALQFEWLWQRPMRSKKSRHLIRGQRGLGRIGTIHRKLNELERILTLFPKLHLELQS